MRLLLRTIVLSCAVTSPSLAQTDTTTKVATWNIEGFNPIDADRVEQLARGLVILDAEVVAVQEVNPDSAVQDIVDEANDLGAEWAAHQLSLLTSSRWPMQMTSYLRLELAILGVCDYHGTLQQPADTTDGRPGRDRAVGSLISCARLCTEMDQNRPCSALVSAHEKTPQVVKPAEFPSDSVSTPSRIRTCDLRIRSALWTCSQGASQVPVACFRCSPHLAAGLPNVARGAFW